MPTNPSNPTPAGNFFGNVDYTDSSSVSNATGKAASNQYGQGSGLVSMGAEGLAPVFKRLMSLVSGNPESVNQEVMPENAAILNQYDTALRAVGMGPRGGGQASATAGLKSSEASTLATTKSKAIKDATAQLGTLASATTGQGLQAESDATHTLGTLIQSAMAGEKLTQDKWMAIGSAVGSIGLAALTGGASLALTGLGTSTGEGLLGMLMKGAKGAGASSFAQSSGDFAVAGDNA